MDFAQVFAIWLHTLAFVIAWGYYGILGRMVLPGLERSLDGPRETAALAAIERRALPLIAVSIVLFVATGSYLLVVDPQYAGLGNVFASTWTTLMLVKHILVVGLVIVGVDVDRLIKRADATNSETERTSVLHRLKVDAEVATGLGAVIALLTIAAQAAV